VNLDREKFRDDVYRGLENDIDIVDTDCVGSKMYTKDKLLPVNTNVFLSGQ